MSIAQSDNMPRGCKLIHLPVHTDKRGSLSFAEAGGAIPFDIERVFWIYDVPQGEERGAHSHNECAEVVIPVQGEFDMTVDDGITKKTIHMDSPHTGILIPPGIWCQLSNFTPDTICVVLASHPYNASGYTHNYQEYQEQLIKVVPYTCEMANIWNNFVAHSKNGTFLLHRSYMDYHAQRFTDCSLLFYKKGKPIALLPANYVSEERTVQSHGGLTYGGLILSESITAADTLQVMSCAIEWMRISLGAQRWIYKPIPHIYHRCAAEEDLYALFRHGAVLTARTASSAITYGHPIAMQELRRRGIKKAQRDGIVYEESTNIAAFWTILEDVLSTKHQKSPVHTLAEIKQLQSSFPNEIRLFVARKGDEILAGTLIYESGQVAHAQYIASSSYGRTVGALDGLFDYLITQVFTAKRYFDFGISTEQGGRYLNEGLIFQKEGFGARTVVYDTYELKIEN